MMNKREWAQWLWLAGRAADKARAETAELTRRVNDTAIVARVHAAKTAQMGYVNEYCVKQELTKHTGKCLYCQGCC